MKQYPPEVKDAARSLYLKRYKPKEIASTMGIPVRTVYHWRDAMHWDDMLASEPLEEAIRRRMTLLVEREDKKPQHLKEMEKLVGQLERLIRIEKMRREEAVKLEGGQPRQYSNGQDQKRGRKKAKKNNVSHLTKEDFTKLETELFEYQREIKAAKHYRNRDILKSRQIGLTWYFAREAFEDAVLTGDNEIFLSATRAQVQVFNRYIKAFCKEKFDVELTGTDCITLNTAHGPAELHFLSSSAQSAQSYHGHVYMDEYFWMRNFTELSKVATAMASHKKWRRTRFSTPSAVTHEAYPYWTGDVFNKRYKKKRVEFPGFSERQSGVLCPDNTWRKIITLDDAIKGGCNLFDIKDLKLEYSPDEFKNLFLCQFVDDLLGVFRLADLEACYADPGEWQDFSLLGARPFGNRPVWGGYDPSRTRDDASFVIIAPPLKPGGVFRVLMRFKWINKSYTWQAARIRELCDQYQFAHIGVDTTGPGIGVYEAIKTFCPYVEPIHYGVAVKNEMVLKAKDIVENGRILWDAALNDVAHAFLTIKQGVTGNGMVTYSAGRTAETGHADVAWAIMHALKHEPLDATMAGRRSSVIIG